MRCSASCCSVSLLLCVLLLLLLLHSYADFAIGRSFRCLLSHNDSTGRHCEQLRCGLKQCACSARLRFGRSAAMVEGDDSEP